MSDGTKIEWTDATVNAVNGCSVLSPGCTNCYAMRSGARGLPNHPSTGLTMPTKAGHVWTGEVRLNEKALLQPLSWRRPRRIFWNAHGDLFHEKVPDEWIDRVFAVCALTPHHKHQILTKRADRMRAYFERYDAAHDHNRADFVADQMAVLLGVLGARGAARCGDHDWDWPLSNVWLGVSVEDPARADERIPHLLATPAAVRFLSCEPLLGPVDLGRLQDGLPINAWLTWLDALDWVIVGGESGPGARPMHPDWARSLRDQCAAAGVAFHFKQWGHWSPERPRSGRWAGFDPSVRPQMWPVGKKAAGRLLDGVEHNGLPA